VRIRTPSAFPLGRARHGTHSSTPDDAREPLPPSSTPWEGEVLMGPREDFDAMATLRGAELTARFEPVGAEDDGVDPRQGSASAPKRRSSSCGGSSTAAGRHIRARSSGSAGSGECARGSLSPRASEAKRAERGLFERQREERSRRNQPAPAPLPIARERRAEKVRERIQEKAPAGKRRPRTPGGGASRPEGAEQRRENRDRRQT